MWLDLTISVKEGEPSADFSRWCDIYYHSDTEHVGELVARRAHGTDLVCFNFDYPDRRGLRFVRQAKIDHPSLPVVMLTVQHSEALAIWAFRTKVWDYLVKPV
ncbi:MAG: response regulator, partial [Burkholderiales bacterium]|nr:response regulator [Burkholderiales bacterium]